MIFQYTLGLIWKNNHFLPLIDFRNNVLEENLRMLSTNHKPPFEQEQPYT
jgi:hypothetical protein